MLWIGIAVMVALIVFGARKTRAQRNWEAVMRQWNDHK